MFNSKRRQNRRQSSLCQSGLRIINAGGPYTSSMKFLLAVMLTLAATLCQAEIHKCSGGVFTDKPCADGGGTTIASKSEMKVGKINFETNLKTYPVHGATFEQVIAAMHKVGPFSAWARWAVAFNFRPKPAANGCTIDNLNISIAGDILMPDWAELRSAQGQDYNAWNRMYAILKTHEDGHVQHGQEFAVLLREKLMGIGPQPCDRLQATADQTKAALTENLKRRDEAYDYRTEHGLRQFNPR